MFENPKPYFADYMSGLSLVYPVRYNAYCRTWESGWAVINIQLYLKGVRTFPMRDDHSRTYTLTAKAEKHVEDCLRWRREYIEKREKYAELLRLVDECKRDLETYWEVLDGLPRLFGDFPR